MKLSPLKVGDILEIKRGKSCIEYVYIVLTGTVLMEHKILDTQKELVYLEIEGYRLFCAYGSKKEKFSLNRITPDEVLQDEYELDCRIYSKDDLPLLINEPNKTKWFDKVLKSDIQNVGTPIYPVLKNCVEKYTVIITSGLSNG